MGKELPTGTRSLALAVVLALGVGCAASHGAGDDGGAARRFDSGATPGSRFDAGTLRDSGPMRRSDGGDSVLTDAGVWVRPDAAGWIPPPYDAGPTGDRAGDEWDGYVESYRFPSGSDHVRIVFDSAAGDGPRTGIVVFGEGPLLPPATDPDVGYPPGVAGPMSPLLDRPWEGFEYPIASASVSGARVLVTIERADLWARWCAIQTPVPTEPGSSSFACVPNSASGSDGTSCYLLDATGTHTPIDCGKLQLCHFAMVCVCDAASCRRGHVGENTFDFHVVGSNGDGSVTLEALHNVHLIRR